jgi:ATP diphosphatase
MTSPDPDRIRSVVQALLGPQGCPWDREQTPESLCDYLVEEVFELVDAVRAGDVHSIQDEMGDVFFLLFFMASLLEARTDLSLDQVWKQSADKMVSRHPHVFGQASFSDRQELMQNWEETKKKERREKKGAAEIEDVLASIPSSLPPLIRAYRLQAKAAKLGFSWESDQDQQEALEREWQEWQQVQDQGRFEDREEEFGDLLFSFVEHGRRRGVKANGALQRANHKFISRFHGMLRLARERGLDWEKLDLQAKDELWNEVKAGEASFD